MAYSCHWPSAKRQRRPSPMRLNELITYRGSNKTTTTNSPPFTLYQRRQSINCAWQLSNYYSLYHNDGQLVRWLKGEEEEEVTTASPTEPSRSCRLKGSISGRSLLQTTAFIPSNSAKSTKISIAGWLLLMLVLVSSSLLLLIGPSIAEDLYLNISHSQGDIEIRDGKRKPIVQLASLIDSSTDQQNNMNEFFTNVSQTYNNHNNNNNNNNLKIELGPKLGLYYYNLPRRKRKASSISDENQILVQTRQGTFKGILISSSNNNDHLFKRYSAEEQLTKRMKSKNDKGHKEDSTNRTTISDTSNSNNHFAHKNVAAFLGVRYASAPIKRLRFMPPTAYLYASNQIHDMQQFGPICRQRFPIPDLNSIMAIVTTSNTVTSSQLNSDTNNNGEPTSQSKATITPDSDNNNNNNNNNSNRSLRLRQQMRLMRSIMSRETYAHLASLIKRLTWFEQSEDCLNLNIYSPIEALKPVSADSRHTTTSGHTWPPSYYTSQQQQQHQLLPVLVIIHGDSFDFGSGSVLAGSKFAREHRMLAVTFNYRLNILGFPPKVASVLRGNLGLMDQVAALHWIKDNIDSFGGSPNNITLMGTKRGAIFVNLLMLSPLAKGFFQRAIMEDGSALTPPVANHILTSATLDRPHHLEPSWKHLRLLAGLCDCPVQQQNQRDVNSTLPASIGLKQQQQSAEETKINALMFECLRHKPIENIMQQIPLDLLQFHQTTGQISISPQWFNSGDELSNGFFSSGSLDGSAGVTNTTTDGQTSLKTANLMPLVDWRQLLTNLSFFNYSSNINMRQLNKLLGQITIKLLQSSSFDDNNKLNGTNIEQWQRLLNAIYGPTSTSMRPLFGPLLDGTVVPEDDLALAMLKPASNFARRDLLIGLSRPAFGVNTRDIIISSSRSSDQKPSTKAADEARVSVESFIDDQLVSADYLIMGDRISERMEQFGLTSEQAIELVNVFVRSFYRFHNQEIANSIINQYLSGSGVSSSSKGQRRFRRPPSKVRTKTTQFTTVAQHDSSNMSTSQISAILEDSLDGNLTINNEPAQENKQQLMLLDSVIDLFQDALISLPVLKTALIHSARQLDSLVGVFVGQQFEKWRQQQERQQLNIHESKTANSNNLTIGNIVEQQQHKSSLAKKQHILESFVLFAQTLFNNSAWPLELHSAAANLHQPKATYLYQLDKNLLLNQIRVAILRAKGQAQQSFSWRSVHETLVGLLIELQNDSSYLLHRLSFACAYDDGELINYGADPDDLDHADTEDDNETTIDNSDNSIVINLYERLCTQFGSIVAKFAATGNVGNIANLQFRLDYNNFGENSDNERQMMDGTFVTRMARFEAKCISSDLQQNNGADHHSVKASDSGRIDVNLTGEQHLQLKRLENKACKRELNSLALEFLASSEGTDDIRLSGDGIHQLNQDPVDIGDGGWKVFSLFSRQVASLAKFMMIKSDHERARETWPTGKLSEEAPSSLVTRGSFWLNFIPALNCSRTQPIIPSSLLTLAATGASTGSGLLPSALNSSLLNLNLYFSCHQQPQAAPRTALELIDGLISQIINQLQAAMGQWSASRELDQLSNSASGSGMNSQQNNHKLRMANMSQSGLSLAEESLLPLEQQTNVSGNVLADDLVMFASNTTGSQVIGSSSRSNEIGVQVKQQTGIVLFICGLLISLTLASGACAVIRQRNQERRDGVRGHQAAPAPPLNTSQHQVHCAQVLELQDARCGGDSNDNLALLVDGAEATAGGAQQPKSEHANNCDLHQQHHYHALKQNQSQINLVSNRQVEQQQHVCTVGQTHEGEFGIYWNGCNGLSLNDNNNNNHQPEIMHQAEGEHYLAYEGDTLMNLCRSHSATIKHQSAIIGSDQQPSPPPPIAADHSTEGMLLDSRPDSSNSLRSMLDRQRQQQHLCLSTEGEASVDQPIMVPILGAGANDCSPSALQHSTSGSHSTAVTNQASGGGAINGRLSSCLTNTSSNNCGGGGGGLTNGGSSSETQATGHSSMSLSSVKKRVKISDPMEVALPKQHALTMVRNKNNKTYHQLNNAYCPIHKNSSNRSLKASGASTESALVLANSYLPADQHLASNCDDGGQYFNLGAFSDNQLHATGAWNQETATSAQIASLMEQQRHLNQNFYLVSDQQPYPTIYHHHQHHQRRSQTDLSSIISEIQPFTGVDSHMVQNPIGSLTLASQQSGEQQQQHQQQKYHTRYHHQHNNYQ